MVIVQWVDVKNISCSTNDNPIDSNTTTSTSLINTLSSNGGEQKCLTKGISVIEELSFNPDDLWFDVGMLLVLIVTMRFLAFLSLYRKSGKR